jgi:putative nucleotidyltransferase with HDIG domain
VVLQENEDSKLKKSIEDDLREAIDHGILVSKLAKLLAISLNEDEEFCYHIAQAGLVHDIGKLKLGEYLYGRKKGVLAIEEMKYIRMHPTLGYEILMKEDYNYIIAEAVLHHHENYDGSGYPSNLKEDEIPYGARILRICDVFAALISKRRYRSSFDIDSAIELMIDEVKNFDMEIFLSFLQAVHSEEMKEILKYVHLINSKYDF